jgi:NADPH-dependent 2,4-dienoyl-CoA reductase/sulfur reductase-like enzyme/rhodanese-related sulfurtransferase
MNKSDYVIIGGVACGPKTGSVLARRLPDAKITLFQKEKFISYGTCGLPYFASGDINSFEELTQTSYGLPRSPEFFKQTKGFDVIPESEVIAIDREKKFVTVKNLQTGETYEHGYGKLVIATGAKPNKPPFPVAESPRIKPFTRPEDAINFRQLAQTGQIGTAIIIGGGFIGCEVAEAAGGLWGIGVTLIEKENQLLPYVLDPEMAKIAERELERNDIKLLIGSTVERISLSPDKNPLVSIKNHNALETDYIFICMGVHPEVELAKSCGLEIGITGGIKVNEHLQTSDPDIYAGGDCIESINLVSGQPFYIPMGSLANRHGRVIAENLAGNEIEFGGALGSFLVKIFDYNIGTVGMTEFAASKAGVKVNTIWGSFPDKPDYYPESKTFTAKMVYDNSEKLIGMQAVGKGDVMRRVDVFSATMQHRGTLDNLLDFEQGYAPPYSEALDPLYHLASGAKAQIKGLHFVSPFGLDSIKESCLWLDVREKDEANAEPWPYAEKHQPMNIPLNDLRTKINELDKNKKVMIICKRGPRSYQAALILSQAGFTDINIIGGGVTALQ